MSKKDLTHEEIEHTFLCKEYSFHAAEEFLEAQGTSGEAWRLRTRRLNMQYDDAEDLTQQSLYFAKRLPAQMIAHIDGWPIPAVVQCQEVSQCPPAGPPFVECPPVVVQNRLTRPAPKYNI